MSDKKKDDRPPVDSPEFKEWLRKRAAKHTKDILSGGPADFEERGPIFGSAENLDKSDAELFPDEIEEYTPEERRQGFKVHAKDEPSEPDNK